MCIRSKGVFTVASGGTHRQQNGKDHRLMSVCIRMIPPDAQTRQGKLHRIVRAFHVGRLGLAPPIEIVHKSNDSRKVYRIYENGEATDFPLSPAERERLHEIEPDIP
jgi:hypothetical protein